MPEDSLIKLGAEIRRRREERGMTQRGLARQAALAGFNITSVTIGNIESGDTPNPGIGSVVAIASALDVPLGALVGEQTDEGDIRLYALVENAKRLCDACVEALTVVSARLLPQTGQRVSSGVSPEEMPEQHRRAREAAPAVERYDRQWVRGDEDEQTPWTESRRRQA